MTELITIHWKWRYFHLDTVRPQIYVGSLVSLQPDCATGHVSPSLLDFTEYITNSIHWAYQIHLMYQCENTGELSKKNYVRLPTDELFMIEKVALTALFAESNSESSMSGSETMQAQLQHHLHQAFPWFSFSVYLLGTGSWKHVCFQDTCAPHMEPQIVSAFPPKPWLPGKLESPMVSKQR